MTNQGLRIKSGGQSFRHCVQDCACDDRMVAAYNQLYGAQLQAPILALLRHQQGKPGPNPDTEEGAELARFIFFCYDTVWRHVRRTQQRTTWWPVNVTGWRLSRTDSEPGFEAVPPHDGECDSSEESNPSSQ